MDENNLTPEESLSIITKTIEETKKGFQENGHIIILWGSLLFIVISSQYILSLLGLYKLFDIAWTCILFPLGAVYTFIYIRRKVKKNNPPKTIFSRLIGTMGWVVGGNLMMLGLVFSHQMGHALAPVFLILFSLLILMIGISIKFTPFILGSILLNLIGFATFMISPEYQGLSLILGSVVGFIIPGILLNKANKKEYV
jgi:hypothetical protein